MRNSGLSIFSVAGDPGGATAIAPLLLALVADGDFKVASGVYRQAQNVWTKHGMSFESLAESMGISDCEQILVRTNANFLLTATSVNGIDLEKHFIAAARNLGIPSLAVLDFWSNYRPRFEDENGHLACLPDRIAVMDAHARDEMAALGFPTDTLLITGQPAFDDLVRWAAAEGTPKGQVLRSSMGVPPEDELILFASQPIAELCESGFGFTNPGYTQYTVLNALISALVVRSVQSDQKIWLWIRPHPRESLAAYDSYRTTEHLQVLVSSEGDSREATFAADLVTGMNSVLLVEAGLMGRNVLSLQPGLQIADALPLDRLGIGTTISREDEILPTLRNVLADLFSSKKSVRRSSPATNATANIVAAISEIFETRLHPAKKALARIATATPVQSIRLSRETTSSPKAQ